MLHFYMPLAADQGVGLASLSGRRQPPKTLYVYCHPPLQASSRICSPTTCDVYVLVLFRLCWLRPDAYVLVGLFS